MPSRTIHDHDGMPLFFCHSRDLLEVFDHDLFVDPGDDNRFPYPSAWANGAKQVGIIELLLFHRAWPCSAFSPKPCRCILLAKSSFILEPDIHLFKADMAWDVTDRFQ